MTALLDHRTVSKAAISSMIATVVDGALYQLLLFVLPTHYAIVALIGAVGGAITNFSINRRWTFHARHDDARLQALRYAFVSGATYLTLRALLWLLVDEAAISPRLAWIPAKVLAFFLVSYPAQRAWVFATRSRSESL